MERLNDLISGLNGQRDALKKQARQAARFRSVAERIRKAEAELLMTKWTNARKELSATSGALNNALLVVAERGKIAAKNAAERAKIAASLPTLRNAEIEKAAIYQRLALEREGLRKEKEQLQESITSIKSRQEQINNDINREKNLFEDAKLAGERLLKEIEDLTKKIDEAEPHQTAATSNLLAAEERVRRSEISLVKSSDEVRACQLNRTNLKSRAQD